MSFGKYDSEGVLYEAYGCHDISVIVLLAEDHECKTKVGRKLKLLYTKEGFTIVHFPIMDFGIPEVQVIRVALEATVSEAQSGRHTGVHCLAIERKARGILHLPLR
jgi:protein-tyrosine phosphatase